MHTMYILYVHNPLYSIYPDVCVQCVIAQYVTMQIYTCGTRYTDSHACILSCPYKKQMIDVCKLSMELEPGAA